MVKVVFYVKHYDNEYEHFNEQHDAFAGYPGISDVAFFF
jgi:hypothetical protein